MGKKHKKKQAKTLAAAEHRASAATAALHDNPVMDKVTAVSELADQPPLVAIAAGTLLLGALLRRPGMARAGARMLAAHALATGMKTVLKNGVDRARPARALRDGEPKLERGRGAGDTGLNSFPSGHTAGAVAVAQALAHTIPAGATPARLAAGAVGALQLPRGAHYVSDVAVGAAIGWLSEKIATAALDAGEGWWRGVAERRAQAGAIEEAEAHPS